VAIAALGRLPKTADSQQHVIDHSRRPDYLYVITADEGAFSGRTLTMKRVATAAAVFSDSPTRIAGHMLTSEFVSRFSRLADQADADPPNALLSVLGLDGATEVVPELSNPRLDGDTLRWEMRLLQGTMSASFGVCSLFLENAAGSTVLRPPGVARPPGSRPTSRNQSAGRAPSYTRAIDLGGQGGVGPPADALGTTPHRMSPAGSREYNRDGCDAGSMPSPARPEANAVATPAGAHR
jgi:hypothetical protein